MFIQVSSVFFFHFQGTKEPIRKIKLVIDF